MIDLNWDVAVIGGGPAGVAAAITAARRGAATLLVERSAELGGAVRHGFHPFLCGLYRNDPEAPFDLLNRGLAEEVVARLDARAGRDGRRRRGRMEVHAVQTPVYGQVLSKLADGESELRVARQTRLSAVGMTGQRIEWIRLAGAVAGEVTADRIIDATGSGEVLRRCPGGFEPGEDGRQLAGYCFLVAGVSSSGLEAVRVPWCVRRAVERGELPEELKFTTFLPGEAGRGGVCKLSLLPKPEPGREERARRLGRRVHDLLRREAPEFAASSVREWSPVVLERSGPALRGEYRLETDDVLRGRHFPDAAARGAWPVEFWDCRTGPALEYLAPGDWYDIPARCLRSANVANLYAAGRCISATGRALASVRMSGTCLALGEAAAGTALAAGSSREI